MRYNRNNNIGRLLIILFFAALLIPVNGFCVDISDDPMDSKVLAAPPNIMFVLDNSGSMDWEFMTTSTDGKFKPSSTEYEYFFPDPGDNEYSSGDSNGTILTGTAREYWKGAWVGFNKIYYNPDSIYTPWPDSTTYTLSNASLTAPFSNPIHTGFGDPSLTLKDTYRTIDPGIIVDNADGAPTFTTPSGSWSESGSEPEWPDVSCCSIYTGGNGVARFTPDIPTTGDFKVYVWWNCYSDRDTNAKVSIKHNGGTTVVYKDQKADSSNVPKTGVCGEWIDIGTYTFNQDDSGYVDIERHAGSTGNSTIADAVKFVSTSDTLITIANAHYYTWYDRDGDDTVDNLEIYLVTWKDDDGDGTLDTRLYYQVNDADGDDKVEEGELIAVSYDPANQADDDVPNDIQPKNYEEDGVTFTYKTDTEDLQNFANWYSYYRRRELAAKAAISKSLVDLEWVYAGYYTINSDVRQTVLPIKVDTNAIIIDNQDSEFASIGSGSWSESGAQNYGQEYEGSSLYSYTGTARWTPDLDAGTYNVYAYWGYAGSRTDQAQYTIVHSGGTSTVVKNHNIQDDAFQWQLLGTYAFNEGTSGYVEVKNIGSTSKVASADAIKFEKASGSINEDETGQLLDLLYSINSHDSTPLRTSLRNVGRYYDQDDGYTGYLGTSPYKTDSDGGSCQQAFAIVMTDGYYNGGDPGVGNQDSGKGAPYADTYSETLADVAMKYYLGDLSSTLPDQLPSNDYDTNTNQHMVTYTISFGVTGTLTPTAAQIADPYFLDPNTPTPVWPDPSDGNSQKIDDLWHAAINGRGEFFSADDPDELVTSLNSVFENLTSRIASGASVSVNGDELNTGSVMYQSTYNSGNWTGNVTAYPINPITGEIKKEDSDILWQAQAQLNGQNWDTGRRILTYNGTDSILSFRYANLTAAQQTALSSSSDMVDYLRGNTLLTGFRSRTSILGDIVHSAPLLVYGDGLDNDLDGETDEDGEETGLIFAGGNDGMLHAFNAQTGDELFAYIPHLVFDNLSALAAPDYSHLFYVDATPYSRKIDYNGSTKVLLAGGLKKGGRGYYCLDISKILYVNDGDLTEDEVSTPTHNDGVDVLWEYPDLNTTAPTAGVDDDLGFSFSDIFIVRSYHSPTSPSTHNWIAVFGNGYNSVNGSAMLYVLNAVTGEVIRKIDTGVSGGNGLSSPALVDTNNDGKLDYAYAGDLKGNMWKFDLTDSDPSNWKVSYTQTDGTTPAPLFTAPGRPITSAPDVMNHCYRDYGHMVLFGTGKFIGENDRTDNSQQSLYGVWDTGFPLGTWDSANNTVSRISGVNLLEQVEINYAVYFGHWLRTLSDYEANWADICTDAANGCTPGQKVPSTPGTHVGWFFDLPMDHNNDNVLDGERVIKDVLIRDKKLVAITFTPNASPCSGGGFSMIHEMDPCDGSRLAYPAFDINGDGEIDSNDMVTFTYTDPVTNQTVTITVPPTGKRFEGLLHTPIIVRLAGRPIEMKIFSSSAGTTEKMFETAEGGFYYWEEVKNED